MRLRPICGAFFLSFIISLFAVRADAEPPGYQKNPEQTVGGAELTPWTIDDVTQQETATQFDISPDGKWVVWVKTTSDKESQSRAANLVLSSLTEKKHIELTRGKERHDQPKWSPDGRWIAFVSTRPIPKEGPSSPTSEDGPRSHLWLINPLGGEPWHLTDAERNIVTFGWINNETILFAAQEDPSFRERTLKESKDTSIVVEDVPSEPPVRLFTLTVESRKVSRFTENEDWVQSLTVSPDGTHAVAIHNKSLSYTYDQRTKPETFLYDLKSGERRQLWKTEKINPVQIEWARDGKGFYVGSAYSSHPIYLMATIRVMYYHDMTRNTTTPLELDWENGLSSDFVVTSDGFIALLANGARPKLARYVHDPDTPRWTRSWIEGEPASHVFGLVISKNDQVVVLEHSTASTPTQWVKATLDGTSLREPVQLTELNPNFQKRSISKTEVIRWKGARGEEVEGVLYYPHRYDPGRRYPLVVMIHGGPMGADLDQWDDRVSYPHNLLAQRGAFLFKPNYHGSSDYGLSWVESISAGNYYDLEIVDIETGVDYLIDRGLVDPERLGVMGWSNGAILTTALTVTTDRYKAASVGAGDVDWASDWGNCEFGAAFDNYYFGASPMERPEMYLKKSPFYQLDKVKTPTLLFHGTEDRAVPTQQSWMHYRALQQLGQTDVRFILFPGEPHGLKKLAHQRRKLEEELNWFDTYLFATAKQTNGSLKPDSPLANALKLASASRIGSKYGRLVKGALIPETVTYGNLEIGRFEITRAQYAAWDKNYPLEPGRENDPAGGITLENAQAYCRWLSQHTGEAFRLGVESEMKPIFDAVKSNENTLDYWAGYMLNPDDAERLAGEVKNLGDAGALLKPVGSFSPLSQDDLIFDLGGNVAEWVMTEDGSGRLMGGSADTPADTKQRTRTSAPGYAGFRVIKGARQE